MDDSTWTCPHDGHHMSSWDDYATHCKDVHDGVPVTVHHNWHGGWNEPDSQARQLADLAAENRRLRGELERLRSTPAVACGCGNAALPGRDHHPACPANLTGDDDE